VVVTVVVSMVVSGAMHRQPAMAPSTVLAAATARVMASSALEAEASAAALAASDAASIRIENGVAMFYFASGKADLAPGAVEALADVVKQARGGAASGRKLLVSGFHDATGDAAQNASLARQRANAVRDALKTAGVAESQVELRQPEKALASSHAEARRVEVSVQ
jgi:outer membrane protein OmpA-like peptidoglycan-associated protein